MAITLRVIVPTRQQLRPFGRTEISEAMRAGLRRASIEAKRIVKELTKRVSVTRESEDSWKVIPVKRLGPRRQSAGVQSKLNKPSIAVFEEGARGHFPPLEASSRGAGLRSWIETKIGPQPSEAALKKLWIKIGFAIQRRGLPNPRREAPFNRPPTFRSAVRDNNMKIFRLFSVKFRDQFVKSVRRRLTRIGVRRV